MHISFSHAFEYHYVSQKKSRENTAEHAPNQREKSIRMHHMFNKKQTQIKESHKRKG
jgi:hypothetical protein